MNKNLIMLALGMLLCAPECFAGRKSAVRKAEACGCEVRKDCSRHYCCCDWTKKPCAKRDCECTKCGDDSKRPSKAKKSSSY